MLAHRASSLAAAILSVGLVGQEDLSNEMHGLITSVLGPEGLADDLHDAVPGVEPKHAVGVDVAAHLVHHGLADMHHAALARALQLAAILRGIVLTTRVSDERLRCGLRVNRLDRRSARCRPTRHLRLADGSTAPGLGDRLASVLSLARAGPSAVAETTREAPLALCHATPRHSAVDPKA